VLAVSDNGWVNFVASSCGAIGFTVILILAIVCIVKLKKRREDTGSVFCCGE